MLDIAVAVEAVQTNYQSPIPDPTLSALQYGGQIYKYKYKHTNTNINTQIHKYKYNNFVC